MRLVDTHCHLDLPDYKDDLDKVIRSARDAGVIRMIIPGTDIESSKRATELASRYDEIFASCGIHPHEADKADERSLPALREMALTKDKVVAIGEIGLDYFKKYAGEDNQKRLLKGCLEIAGELDLPVILHNRQADADMIGILKDIPAGLEGVVHCCSVEPGVVKEFLDLGLHISFAGYITFNNDKAGLSKVLRDLPLEKLLLETDSPYITPVPFRGKRNEPANVRYLLDVYASAYGLTKEDIARITTHNANRLFRLGIDEKRAVAYPIRSSLYLNITNRCTNKCVFCARQYLNFVKGHNLKLDSEPTAEEVIAEMGDIAGYEEVVFCGYGEPTLRLDVVKKVAAYLKEKGKKVRLTTNGQGDIINGRSIAGELKGLVDRVSISLNAPDAEKYDKLCKSVFGTAAYKAVLDFISSCGKAGIKTEVTCLDMIGEEDVDICKDMAVKMGAGFRLRKLDIVG